MVILESSQMSSYQYIALRQTDSQTVRQTDIQTDRQIGTQTDTQTDR